MATGDIIAFQILGAGTLPNGGNIDGNGVIARIRLEGLAGNIGGSYDLSKLIGSGASPGWNRARVYSAANVTRTVALTEKIIRRPFPNEALRIEQAVGSDLDIYACLTEEWFVADTLSSVSIAAGFYAGCTVSTLTGAGLTNSSSRAYRMPQINWVGLEPWRRMTGSGLTVEAIIDHHNARDGQPVAAVDFYVSRSGATSMASTSAMVLSDEITTPYRPGVFRATVPIGNLTQGEGDLGATIYPWVGTATWDTNSAEFDSFPCTGTPKLYPVNIDTDGSYARAGAYVSHTGVQIGTPSIGLLSAMGAYVPGTTPAYADIKAVADAARAWNNNAANRARVHDDMAGIFAVVPSGVQIGTWGTAALNNQTTYPPGLGYFGITSQAGASRSNTGLTTNARAHPSRTMLDNLGIFPGAAGSVAHTVTDGSGAGATTTQPTKAAAVYLVVRDCSGTGNNDNINQVFSRPGYRWLHRNNFTAFGDDVIINNASLFAGLVQLHGCTIDNSANSRRADCNSASVIGCHLPRCTLVSLPAGASPEIKGRMVHNVRIDSDDAGTAGVMVLAGHLRAIGVRGESWVNVLLRKVRTGATAGSLGSGESPSFQISSDFAPGNIDQPAITNVNRAYLSMAGARANGPYQEAGTLRIVKEVRDIGIAASQLNTKGDLFPGAGGASGNRTGTFAYRFGNARFGIVSGDNGANNEAGTSPTAWNGDAMAPLSQVNAGYGNLWVNDTSLAVGNTLAAAGDYTPRAALFDRIPAGRAVTGFDLLGTARRNDGSGAAGAIERADSLVAPASARFEQFAGSPGLSGLVLLLPAGVVQAQGVAAPLLSWTGSLAPAGAGQGQRAGPALVVRMATLAVATAAMPQRATASLLMPDAHAEWLVPVMCAHPHRATAGAVIAGSAVRTARTLVPDPVETTLSVS
jgi:hypothetical protein